MLFVFLCSTPIINFNIFVKIWWLYSLYTAALIQMSCNFIHVIILQFDPDIVLVSAGFDSARGDPKVHILKEAKRFSF